MQGPPGTGKTHTVKGILNVWYVIHYRRYHDAWRTAAAKQLLHLQVSSGTLHDSAVCVHAEALQARLRPQVHA